MATQNLPPLSPSEFPQRIQPATSEEFRQYNGELINSLWALGERFVPAPILSTCDFEHQWGLNSGGIRCHRSATIHHLESEQEFCLEHFQAVCRG